MTRDEEKAFEELRKLAVTKTFSPGDVIWEEGTGAEFFALVEEGVVELRKATEYPGKHVVIGLYRQGSFVGEETLAGAAHFTLGAVALGKTVLSAFSSSAIEQFAQKSPEASIKVYKAVFRAEAARLKQAYDRMTSIF